MMYEGIELKAFLQCQKEKYEKEIARLNYKIAGLQMDNRSLQKKCKTVYQPDYNRLFNQCAQIQSDYIKLQKDYTQLQIDFDAEKKKGLMYDKLQADFDTLKSNYDVLQSDIKTRDTMIKTNKNLVRNFAQFALKSLDNSNVVCIASAIQDTNEYKRLKKRYGNVSATCIAYYINKILAV